MASLRQLLTLRLTKRDLMKHSDSPTTTPNISYQKSISSMHFTWRTRIDSKRLRRSSSKLTSHRKQLTCTSTSKIGTLRSQWLDSIIQRASTRCSLIKLNSISMDAKISRRLSKRSSTPRNLRRPSMSIRRRECSAKHLELLKSMLLILCHRSTRTTLGVLRHRTSHRKRS